MFFYSINVTKLHFWCIVYFSMLVSALYFIIMQNKFISKESVKMQIGKNKKCVSNKLALILFFLIFIATIVVNFTPARQKLKNGKCDNISADSCLPKSILEKTSYGFSGENSTLVQGDKYQAGSKSGNCVICDKTNAVLFARLKIINVKPSNVKTICTKIFVLRKYSFKSMLLKKRFSYVDMSPSIHHFLENVIIIC